MIDFWSTSISTLNKTVRKNNSFLINYSIVIIDVLATESVILFLCSIIGG